ncbi:MAG: LPS-assembly protein LptD [Sphingomonadales bacterium]|nr:LPS-assembly protein LptD [Sphingomonadales bacterium]
MSNPADTLKRSIATPKSDLDNPIVYKSADSIWFNIRKNKVYLYKNASIEYGDMNLSAHFIEIDLTKKEIFAKGGPDSAGKYSDLPILKDGSDNYKADSIRYNSKSKKGRVYGLRLTQDEAVIHLNKVMKQDDGSFIGQSGKITTCNEDHPHFYFNASRIKVIPNNKALFGAANLVVEDVPTPLAVPFGIAPLKKGQRNGILFPGYGYNQFNKSFYLQNFGYYLGLGEHADLTLTTDAYLNGDLRFGVSSNMIKRYRYRSNFGLGASWFGNGTERSNPAFKRNLDLSIRGNFGFDPKYLPGISLNGDINIQTGNFNRLNSRDINTISNQQFQSSVNFGKTFFQNKVNFTAAARHSQNTANRDFRLELPSINLGVSSLTPFERKNSSGNRWYEQLRLSYNMQFSNVINTKDTILFSRDYKKALEKTQSGISHSLPINTNIKLLKGIVNMSPSFNYRETWYLKATDQFMDDTGKIQTKEENGFFRINNWDFNTGFTTNIYGTFQRTNAKKIKAIRHTITPTISMGYQPTISAALRGWERNYTDTAGKLVRYNRFEKGIYGGGQSQSESGYVGIGVNNNLQGKKVVSTDSNGKEKLEKFNLIDQLSFNTRYNLAASKFKWNDVSANFNTTLKKNINITARSAFSLYQKDSLLKNVQRFLYEDKKTPLRMRSASMSISTRFGPEMFRKKPENTAIQNKENGEDQEKKDIVNRPDEYFHFDIPWNIALTYVFDYNAEAKTTSLRVGSNRINISGDLSITPEWKIGYTTGYDLHNKEIASSQFTVSRNLHCWQIDFNWVPSGFAKQWTFSIRPKSGMLQDMKLNKRAFFNPVMF